MTVCHPWKKIKFADPVFKQTFIKKT